MAFLDILTRKASRPAGGSGLARTVGPAALEVTPRHVIVGDHYAATLAVVGYPAEVGPAWLEQLLGFPGRASAWWFLGTLG